MKGGKSDELYVYKYYLERGHTFDEISKWTYNEYITALAFIVMEANE